MLTAAHDVAPVAGPSRKTSRATRLVQAAALAAVLVPLGTVALEADVIPCNSTQSGGGCFGSGGGSGYYYSGGGDQWNEWDFYDYGLVYSFTIEGIPTSDFILSVQDFVTTQTDLLTGHFLDNYPDLTCVPTFDVGRCGLFVVAIEDGSPSWEDGYLAYIAWFVNDDPLSSPPADSYITILQAKNGTGGVFGNTLTDITYDPLAVPGGVDPGISGKGDGFSTFGVFTNPVPEPASLILVGTGLAGAIYRARRRRRQS